MATILDSGNRSEFPTGAVRDIQDGKGRFDLLPVDALFDLVRHFGSGAKKYGVDNWRKGIPLSRYMDSAARHLFKLKRGDTDEPHAIAAVWNLMCLVETRHMIETGKLPKELDDL